LTYLVTGGEPPPTQIQTLSVVRPGDAVIGRDAPALVVVPARTGPNLHLVPVRGVTVRDV
jgi:hypothetical protein